MAYFTDSEYRLLLAAIAREKEICRKVIADSPTVGEIDLIKEMKNIEAKLRELQYGDKEEIKLKTVAITDGMSEDCLVIKTDATHDQIDQWCRNYKAALIAGKTEEPELFHQLKKTNKVSVVYDSGIDIIPSLDAREIVRNADEVFDISDYDEVTVLTDVDPETPVAIVGPYVRAEWYRAGEGICGDYDPEDPDDIELLRFDIYKRYNPFVDDWMEVEDASYCTQVPANTPTNELVEKLRVIYDRFSDVLDCDLEASVKKLGEELSWIS